MYLTLSKSNSSYGFFGKKKQETPPKPTENKVVSPKKEAKPSLEQIMVHPLTDDKLMELIFLEDDFVNRMINKPRLECLLEIYKTLAEYYDSIKDPISTYFIEKIQKTVSHASVLKFFMAGPNSTTNQSSPVRVFPNHSPFSSPEVVSPDANDPAKKLSKKRTLEAEKTVRSRKTLMNFDVDRVLNEEKDAHTTLVASTMESKDLNDGLLKRNLQDQADIIKAKIEKRRNSNFLKSSMTLNDSSSFLDPEAKSKGMLSRQGTFQALGENYQKDKILEELNLISSHPISKGKEFGNILFDLGSSREHHPQGSGELGKDSPQVLSKLGKQEKSREQFEIKPFSVSINDEKGPNNIASPNKSQKDDKIQRYDDTKANKDHTPEILKEATMEVNKNHQSISGKEAEENLAERGLSEVGAPKRGDKEGSIQFDTSQRAEMKESSDRKEGNSKSE